MAFDYKKEYKEFYMPAGKPEIVTVPPVNFVAVRGHGNPNEPDGEYKKALEILYGVAFTVKMSYKGDHKIDGYFEYVVPPLEGFWWMDGIDGIDYTDKSKFSWISVIRLPEFVTPGEFEWAVKTCEAKKHSDFSKAEFLRYDEGLCVQCMHTGPFDDEPATFEKMDAYALERGFVTDITDSRFHHEIYLSDARRTAPQKLKTVLRHPVKKI